METKSANSQPKIEVKEKRRYAVVGTGGRSSMFILPIVRDYPEVAELVGLCDPSSVRRAFHQNRLKTEYNHPGVAEYDTADFEKMVKEQKVDTVIVCTVDAYHHEYIVRALEAGCDAVTEKPMTTDEHKCQEILDAVKRTGKSVRVTFNYRWASGAGKVWEVLNQGTIGNVKHVHMEYLLNTKHGADYFRRWHSDKSQSGGLLIHKSTHHFDLVNWWINGIPKQVFAYGDLVYYGKENAIARGQEKWTKYPRYTGYDTGDDPFALKLDSEGMSGLYRGAEKETGYLRDQNVFRDGITIEDMMSVMVKYRSGQVLNYSLNAYCPWEGFRVHFAGDAGRLEFLETHASHIIGGQTDKQLGKEQAGNRFQLRVMPLFQEPYEVDVPLPGEGGHGGADPLLQAEIFDPNAPEDTMGRSAGHEQGAASILIGTAANHSMERNQPVNIDDLVRLPEKARNLSDLV